MELNERDEENEKSITSSRTSLTSSTIEQRNAKVAEILDACKWKDLDLLRTLAASESGLVSDDVRRQACSCYDATLQDHN